MDDQVHLQRMRLFVACFMVLLALLLLILSLVLFFATKNPWAFVLLFGLWLPGETLSRTYRFYRSSHK